MDNKKVTPGSTPVKYRMKISIGKRMVLARSKWRRKPLYRKKECYVYVDRDMIPNVIREQERRDAELKTMQHRIHQKGVKSYI